MSHTDPWREHVLAKSFLLGEGVILAGYEVQVGRKSILLSPLLTRTEILYRI